MTKLTDAQLIVLSKAAARDDGAGVVPPRMNKAAAAKVGSSLAARKLMREIRSKPGMPVWREDEQGRRIGGCSRAGSTKGLFAPIGFESRSEAENTFAADLFTFDAARDALRPILDKVWRATLISVLRALRKPPKLIDRIVRPQFHRSWHGANPLHANKSEAAESRNPPISQNLEPLVLEGSRQIKRPVLWGTAPPAALGDHAPTR